MHGGKGASVPVNLIDSEFFSLTGRRMYGVAYTIAKAPEKDSGEEVFRGAGGLNVYRRDTFPRAWAVHELLPGGNFDDPDSFRRKAYITGAAPRVESCAAPETVQLVEHDADRLVIQADLACDGMVVLSDVFYPEKRRARVDHRPAEIFQVNGAMRGVLVPRGPHTVTMRYRPVSVYLGAFLTFLGILIPVLLRFRRPSAG